MAKKKRTKKQDKYNLMVLNLLKELSKQREARLSIREISRILKINPMAVSRAIRKLRPILDIKTGSNFESFRLPVHLIRLREDMKNSSIKELMRKAKLSERILKEIYKR